MGAGKVVALACVDLQGDFISFYDQAITPGEGCFLFLRKTLFPFLRKKQEKVAEIISDFRQPRPGFKGDMCHPGTLGYESRLPEELRRGPQWIKAAVSPLWSRQGIGDPNSTPGKPHADQSGFSNWAATCIGRPEEVVVVLFGLTLEYCVFCTAYEFRNLGYEVRIAWEGCELSPDAYSAGLQRKKFASQIPLSQVAPPISWEELKRELSMQSWR